MAASPIDIVLRLERIPTVRPYAKFIVQVANELHEGEASDFAWLIAGVGERETRWGTARELDRPGPAGRGDGGHGHGLLQVDDRSHPDLIMLRMPDGSPQWADPLMNIKMGAGILSGCLAAFRENVEAALAAYNCGVGHERHVLAAGMDPSACTAGHDYGRWVLDEIAKWGIDVHWGRR